MVESREILPTSLDHALLANRVVSVLSQVVRGRHVPDKTSAMDEALRFLRFIEKGKRSTENREVSQDSYEAALAYGEAIRALGLQLPPPEPTTDFGEFLDRLIGITIELRDDKEVDKTEVDSLAKFFKTVRDITFGSRQARIEIVKFTE